MTKFQDNHEELLKHTEQKLIEIEATLEQSRQQYEALLQELELTPKQIAAFAQNPDQFTAEEWKYIQEEHQKLDAQLQLELSQITNPQRTKKVQQEQSFIRPHWLFVR